MKMRRKRVTGGGWHSPSNRPGDGEGKAIKRGRWGDELSAIIHVISLCSHHSILIKVNIMSAFFR